jgi:hypothetical protein
MRGNYCTLNQLSLLYLQYKMMAYPEYQYIYISIIDKTADKQKVLKRYHNNISRNQFGGNENQVFWRKR